MAFEIPKQPYSGKIGETTIGTGSSAVKLGGEDAYPFHLFEGSMPNPPKIAMEIWDYDPSEEWPAAALAPFKEVVSSPDAWAKKCVEEYGADIIVLQLKSTDPNAMDRGPEEAADVAKKVAEAVDVPVIFWGTANNQKDEEVLKKIAETCEGKNVSLAPVEEGNHKGVGATALGYKHALVASSPIDVNLAKQLNILLGNLGVQSDAIMIDPTTGGLGYGMEYSYSVMERIRMAALTQEDDKLQIPMINNLGNEIWKSKEAAQSMEEAPLLGDPERRGVLMESVAAVCYLLAGSDVVVLRHPESVRLARSFYERMLNGGTAADVEGLKKLLEPETADLLSLSPEPNLDFGADEKEKPAKKKAAQPKKAEKAAEPEKKAKKEPPKEKPAPPKKEKEEKEKEEKVVDLKAKEAATKKAEEEAKAKEEAEAKAQAEAEAKQKAEQEARVKAEAEAKRKAEQAAQQKTAEKAKEKEHLQALRMKRAEEREKLSEKRDAAAEAAKAKTPAKEQLDLVGKLIQGLDRIHKRTTY